MNKILIGLVLMAPSPVHAAPVFNFDAVAIEAFEHILETHRIQAETQRAGAAEAIELQIQIAQEIKASLSHLESSVLNTRSALSSVGRGDRLSLAVRALASEMAGLTFSATQSAGAIANIKRQVREPGRNEQLLGKAFLLASSADEIKKRGRIAADDICLRIVLPLRQMRRIDDVRMLATSSPAMKSAATRMSVEADHLVDFVSGDPRRGPGPVDPIPNFCNPEDIPPHA